MNDGAFPGVGENCAVNLSTVKPLDRLLRSKRKQGDRSLVDDSDAV